MTTLAEYRARWEDAPIELVRNSSDWRPIVDLIDGWAKEKLSAASYYSSRELDHWSREQGVAFSPLLREWWRLAGRHPFVDPGLLRDNSFFLSPAHHDLVRMDWLAITIDDVQTESGNGIHFDFLSVDDPDVHGINTTVCPDHDPNLPWFKGRFLATELRIPALIYATLLYHLFEPSDLVVETANYLTVARPGLRGGEPDLKIISGLELRRFANPTIVGDLYSNGTDIIYSWWMGFACRTSDAADRVKHITPTSVSPRGNR